MNEIKCIRNLDSRCVIKWRLTDICNYHCSYCIRKPLSDTSAENYDRIETAKRVAELAEQLTKNTGKKCKVDLIGGEIIVLPDLFDIITELSQHASVDRINITTNFSRKAEYFEELRQHCVDPVSMSMTASYHPNYCKLTLQDWINKAVRVSKVMDYFKCETVQLKDSTHIDEFIKLCQENNLHYMVEGDLLDESLNGVKYSSKKTHPRYDVTFADGTVKGFGTRNSFLKEYGENGMSVKTDGFLCTRDFDYVYIEKDEVFTCVSKYNIHDFKLAEKPHPCYRGKDGICTLCGNISLLAPCQSRECF